jgi:hypothetical protein
MGRDWPRGRVVLFNHVYERSEWSDNTRRTRKGWGDFNEVGKWEGLVREAGELGRLRGNGRRGRCGRPSGPSLPLVDGDELELRNSWETEFRGGELFSRPAVGGILGLSLVGDGGTSRE